MNLRSSSALTRHGVPAGSPGQATAVTSSNRPSTPDSVADFTQASIHTTSAAFRAMSPTEPSGCTVTITSHRAS